MDTLGGGGNTGEGENLGGTDTQWMEGIDTQGCMYTRGGKKRGDKHIIHTVSLFIQS